MKNTKKKNENRLKKKRKIRKFQTSNSLYEYSRST